MIDRRVQLLLLMNCHPCCAVCFSERLDDIAAAIQSGAAVVHYDGDMAVALHATGHGMSLLRSFPMVDDAAA
jgi:hypothetical protein